MRLSQGLPKLRAPADVYNRARILVSGNKRKPFTKDEDETILEHMASTTSSEPFAELSRKLNRPLESLTDRYEKLINKKNYKSGPLRHHESCLILKTVLCKQDQSLREVCQKLEDDLNRPHDIIYQHYVWILEPLIKMYETVSLDVDYRVDVFQYLVDNDIEYTKDVDWSVLAK